jgi:hypothetical protein
LNGITASKVGQSLTITSSFVNTTIVGVGLSSVTGIPGSYTVNGLSQTLSLAGNNLTLSNGGGTVTLPGFTNQWTTTGANFISAAYNASISGILTSSGLNIPSLTGTGVRFVGADAAGNLTIKTISGFVQGTNTTSVTSIAFFTGQNSSITGSSQLTWNATSSTLGVAGNVQLGASSVSGSNGAVIIQLLLASTAPSALSNGAIVIADPGTDNAIASTNEQGSTSAVGVVVGSCSPGSLCNVAISGVVQVLSNTGSIRGQHCITSVNPGSADSIPSPNPGSSIGVWLQSVNAGAYGNVLLK